MEHDVQVDGGRDNRQKMRHALEFLYIPEVCSAVSETFLYVRVATWPRC